MTTFRLPLLIPLVVYNGWLIKNSSKYVMLMTQMKITAEENSIKYMYEVFCGGPHDGSVWNLLITIKPWNVCTFI